MVQPGVHGTGAVPTHFPAAGLLVVSRCFVPLTVPTGELIVKVASNCVTGPTRPGGCGPIVTVAVSSKVPGYGPSAVPLTTSVNVVSPLGLHVKTPPWKK